MGTHGAPARPVKRKVLAGLVSAATAAATVAALSVIGTGDTQPLPQPQHVGASSPLDSAMRRDLQLSPDQAQARARDEALAAKSVETLRQALGTAYAGAWFDGTSRRLTVGIVDPAYGDIVRSAGADPKVVKNNLVGLTGMKSRIDRLATAGVPASVVGWYVDPASNTVVVEARRDAAAEEFIRRVRGAGSLVRAEWTTRSPVVYADIVGGAGFTFGDSRCSIGFAATGANGTTHFLTAGHCTQFKGIVLADGQELGRVDEGVFDADGDFGLVSITDPDARATPVVRAVNGGLITVTGSRQAPIGASVCRSGATTGFFCGEILALDQTVNYGGGVIVQGLTRTSVCAEPGDSGGPFVSGTQAQGLTSGGAGDCKSGGVTFFQPVNEAARKLGVTLAATQ